MHIPSYQIRNVLNAYRKHLWEGANEKYGGDGSNFCGPNINNAGRGRRQAIIRMIGVGIFDKINQFCTRCNADGKTGLQVQMASEAPAGLKPDREKRFSFHVMDEHNEKIRHFISVEGSDFFLKKLVPEEMDNMETNPDK